MGNQTLQKLAHDYATGAISQYEYRKLRTALIDDITGYQASPETAPPVESANDGHKTGPGAYSGNLKKYKLIVLVIVTIAIILVVINREEDTPAKVKATSDYHQNIPGNILIVCSVNPLALSGNIYSRT